MTWFEALLGMIRDNGTPLDLRGVLNFVGFDFQPYEAEDGTTGWTIGFPGSSWTPTTRDVYVDAATTVDTDDQEGSRARPFKTLSAALAAFPSAALVHIAPGTYSGEGTLIYAGTELAIQGTFRGVSTTLPTISMAEGALYLTDVEAVVSGGADVVARDSSLGAVACASFDAEDCFLGGNVTSTGVIGLQHCTVDAAISCGASGAAARDTYFNSGTSFTFTGPTGTFDVDDDTARTIVENSVPVSGGDSSMTKFNGAKYTASTSAAAAITGINKGSTGSIEYYYFIEGQVCHVRVLIAYSGTGMSVTAPFIPLPNGLVVDSEQLQFYYQTMAHWAFNNDGVAEAISSTIATWSGGAPTGLGVAVTSVHTTIDDGDRQILEIAIPFKLP